MIQKAKYVPGIVTKDSSLNYTKTGGDLSPKKVLIVCMRTMKKNPGNTMLTKMIGSTPPIPK